MDIDLLSKIVKEVILDNDEVTLPGVGSFVTEIVPSSFSDKGYTINPPYRRLSFRQRQNPEDNSIAAVYAKSNQIGLDQAQVIIGGFLSEMKEVLMQKKVITFPELGRLRATKENNFFFVADEELDIWPAGFGLEPVSLKTHVETSQEVSEAVSSLKDILTEEAVPVAETTEVEEEEVAAKQIAETANKGEAVKATEPVKNMPATKGASNKLLVAAICIAAFLVILLAAYITVSRLYPDFIDTLLYTKEDLDFLRSLVVDPTVTK